MSDAAAELRSETPAEPQGATAPEAPAEPSAYQRRKAREAERKAEAEKRAAAREARKAATAAKPEPAQPAEPDRTDKDRAENASAFLGGVLWPVLALVWRLAGFQLDAAKPEELAESAAGFVPWLRRWRWLDDMCGWAGAPARFVRLVARYSKRAPAKVVPLKSPSEAPKP